MVNRINACLLHTVQSFRSACHAPQLGPSSAKRQHLVERLAGSSPAAILALRAPRALVGACCLPLAAEQGGLGGRGGERTAAVPTAGRRAVCKGIMSSLMQQQLHGTRSVHTARCGPHKIGRSSCGASCVLDGEPHAVLDAAHRLPLRAIPSAAPSQPPNIAESRPNSFTPVCIGKHCRASFKRTTRQPSCFATSIAAVPPPLAYLHARQPTLAQPACMQRMARRASACMRAWFERVLKPAMRGRRRRSAVIHTGIQAAGVHSASLLIRPIQVAQQLSASTNASDDSRKSPARRRRRHPLDSSCARAAAPAPVLDRLGASIGAAETAFGVAPAAPCCLACPL